MPLATRARSQARHAPRTVRRAYRELASSPDTAPAHTSVGPQLLLALSHCSLLRLEHSTCTGRGVTSPRPSPPVRSCFLSTQTSSDPLRDAQIHCCRALGSARASWPPDGAPARAPNPWRAIAGDTTAAGVSDADYNLSYPRFRQLRVLGSAGLTSHPRRAPTARDLAMAVCAFDRRSHGRICAQSGCTCPAVSRGSSRTSMGGRGAENRQLAPTDMLGRCNVDPRA
jgi:hypothetical protein